MRVFSALFIAGLWLTLVPLTQAQSTPPTLTVWVRDQEGTGVPGLRVTLRDLRGENAHGAITDLAGRVALVPPANDAVRLVVTGVDPRGQQVRMGTVSFLDDMSLRVNLGVGDPLVPFVLGTDGLLYLDPDEYAAERGPANAGAASAGAQLAAPAATAPAAVAAPTLIPLPTTASASAAPTTAPVSRQGVLWIVLLMVGLVVVVGLTHSFRRGVQP